VAERAASVNRERMEVPETGLARTRCYAPARTLRNVPLDRGDERRPRAGDVISTYAIHLHRGQPAHVGRIVHCPHHECAASRVDLPHEVGVHVLAVRPERAGPGRGERVRGVHQPVGDQDSPRNVGREFGGTAHRTVVEGVHSAWPAVRGQKRRGRLNDARALQFAVDRQTIPDQFEHLAQCRNRVPVDAHEAHGAEREFAERLSGRARRAWRGGRIVMNDHVAVACGMDVELDTVRAEGQRAFERGEGILQSLS